MKRAPLLVWLILSSAWPCTFAQTPATPAAPAVKTASDKVKGYRDVSVTEFDALRQDKKNVVLDVRTPKEFATGHIPGAINIDWNAGNFEQKVKALDPSKTYLVHCAAGGRSAKACTKMVELKFPHCVNMKDGFKQWEKSGKETVRPK
jgi:phage shock protein E